MRPLHFALCLLLAAGICVACSGSQPPRTTTGNSAPSPENTVVARYADTTITLAELDSAYAASVGGRENAADSSLQDYRHFLEQYVNFRLKVRAARDAGLDTLSSVQRDVRSYLQKRARPRLMREKVYEPVVRTLYERRKQEVDVSHILIRPSSEQDTLDAYRTIHKIADSLDRGVSFADLAYRNSDDPSARKKGRAGFRGRLGYIRAGQIVEPFEERMYALDPGQVSDVFRTKFGYHIIKVHGRRPAKPAVRLAHILRRPKGDSTETRHFLDSLRTAIVAGSTSFSAAAKAHSQDRRSARRGGNLGAVDPRELPSRLRQAVTRLDSAGAVSDVVRTRFGYHLVKLTGREGTKTFEESYDQLKKQVTGQPRVRRRKRAYAHNIRADAGVTVDTARILDATGLPTVDSLARPLLSVADPSTAARPVAALGDSTYTLDQMAWHLTQTDGGAEMTVAGLIESFLNEKAFQYAGTRLARQDPSLARELKKYREGVLLFRYMQDSVWTAAAQDTAGLRTTYEQNREQYRFPPRVRTVVLRAPADSLLKPYQSSYRKTGSLPSAVKQASEDSLVSVDTVFVTDRSAEVYQSVRSLPDGELAGPTRQRNESLLMIRDTLLPARRKTFEEARSNVIQDHQERYEERVLRRLRKRYDAETFPGRLRPPFSDVSSSTP